MIRKRIVFAVLAAGAVAGLTSNADAHSPTDFHRHRFEVLVECGRRWEPRGDYGNRFEAERAAGHLRHEGFRVEVRAC